MFQGKGRILVLLPGAEAEWSALSSEPSRAGRKFLFTWRAALPFTPQVAVGARAAHISGSALERKPAFGSGAAGSDSWRHGCRSISQRFVTSFSNGPTDFGRTFPSSELSRDNRTLFQHLGFSAVLHPRRHLQVPPDPPHAGCSLCACTATARTEKVSPQLLLDWGFSLLLYTLFAPGSVTAGSILCSMQPYEDDSHYRAVGRKLSVGCGKGWGGCGHQVLPIRVPPCGREQLQGWGP